MSCELDFVTQLYKAVKPDIQIGKHYFITYKLSVKGVGWVDEMDELVGSTQIVYKLWGYPDPGIFVAPFFAIPFLCFKPYNKYIPYFNAMKMGADPDQVIKRLLEEKSKTLSCTSQCR